MSRIKNNPLLKGISGMLGKTIVFKQWQGKLIMANAPSKRRKLSKKQKESVERFKRATRYAKRMMTLPEHKADYLKGIAPNKNNASRVAVTDYLNPPKVHYIKARGYTGAIGDTITIKATDDFRVMEVKVEIYKKGQRLPLEDGNAVPVFRKKNIWKYATTVANPEIAGTVINVTAFDKPGHKGEGEMRL